MKRYIYSGRMGTAQDENRPIVEDLDLLEKAVCEAQMQGPLRAMQFHAYTGDDGPTFDLCGIYEQPSWDDSRYESAIIAHYDESFSCAPEICEIGRLLAARCGVPFHYAYEDEPTWARSHGEPPPRDFTMQWRARWWKNDGVPHSAVGEDVVTTKNIEDAHKAIHALVNARIDPAAGRVECEVRNPIKDEWRRPEVLRGEVLRGERIASSDIIEALRDGYRQSAAASHMLREYRTHHAEIDTLHLIENMAMAFELQVCDFDRVSAWVHGDIGDQELDDDVGPRIRASEVQWNALFTLRRRLAAGESIAVILHEYCTQRRSFGFLEVKDLVARALDCRFSRHDRLEQWVTCSKAVEGWLVRGYRRDDEEFDKDLAALIAEQFPRKVS